MLHLGLKIWLKIPVSAILGDITCSSWQPLIFLGVLRKPFRKFCPENWAFVFLSNCRTSIDLGDVTPHNVKQLKRLHSVVFPVAYNDKFYVDILEAGELAKLAYYNDIVVGAVCCRVDTSENMRRLYIMTLGCLYPYRRLGIGTVMVNHILKYVENDGNFDSIFL